MIVADDHRQAVANSGERNKHTLVAFHVWPSPRKALEAAGFDVSDEREVVVVDVEDRPGTAAAIFRRIADANVNVDFSYLGANNRMVIGAKDVKKLTELFSLEAAGARR